MNQKTLLVCTAIILVAVLAIAAILYNNQDFSSQMGIMGNDSQFDTTAPDGSHPEKTDPPAPDFYFTDYDGNRLQLSQFEGKPVILNFWASWCGPCKSEMPDLEEAFKTYGGDIHFIILNMTDGSRETVQSARNYIDSQGYTFPVYYDTNQNGAISYGVSGIPVTFFIDAEGYVVGMYSGAMTANILQQGIDLITK